MPCNGSGIPPFHSHFAKSSAMEASVNVDERLGDACPQAQNGFYCLVVQHDQAHNCVYETEECNTDVLPFTCHLREGLNNPILYTSFFLYF